MYHDSNKIRARDPVDDTAPSEAWLFAQAILGKPIPDPRAAAQRARHDAELLEFVESISDGTQHAGYRLENDAAQVRHDRELQEWLAAISEKHEYLWRKLQQEEADARQAQQRYEHFLETLGVQEAEWDPAKHPRRGSAPNAGWFASTGGSSGSAGSGGAPATPKSQTTGGQASEPTPAPATKSQFPAPHRGSWISGTRGDGVFRFDDSLENQQAGLAGKEVRFKSQNVAVGGLPPEAYYGGDASASTVEIATVTGTDVDNRAADAEMRKKLGKDWKRPKGYVWNHAGPPGSKVMELVDARVHRGLSHKGPAAEPRARLRAARAGKTSGRSMAALTVYLTARDALRATGVLRPDYEVAEQETYHYVADDGSVFVVRPGGLLSSPVREFVAGPRKGETEAISRDEVDAYRRQAEEEWGKYIPGSLLSGPRFIPGKKRKSLPLIEYRHGVPQEVGWIDQHGVHRHEVPKARSI